MKRFVILFLFCLFMATPHAKADFGRQYIQCSRNLGNESLVINLQKKKNNLTYHAGTTSSKRYSLPTPQKLYLISSTGRYMTFSNNQSPVQETVKIPTDSYGLNSSGFEVVYERFNVVNDVISEVSFLCFSKLLGSL